MQNTNLSQNNTQKGVGYKNIENKENEKNICGMKNGFSPSSSGDEAYASSFLNESSFGETPLQAEPGLPQCNLQPTPIDENFVKRALIQFFDNGENSPQRYKFRVRFNFVDDTDAEFIASLTKDMRNFKKHIPEDCRADIEHFASQIRKNVKAEFGVYPWLGKLHLNQGKGRHQHSQIEPYTAVAIWYDAENKGWSGVFAFYDWIKPFDLSAEYLTDLQKKGNCKGQDLFINPKYDTRQRPKTWAQKRAESMGMKK